MKEKIDWLDEQPYIGKYFICKIKRLIMNVVYNVTTSLEVHLLQKYYAEFQFRKKDLFFDAKMPIIILTYNYENAQDVIGQINTQLVKIYDFEVYHASANPQVLTDSECRLKEIALQSQLASKNGKNIGNVKFETLIAETLTPTDLREQKGKKFNRILQYNVIQNGKKQLSYDIEKFLLLTITLTNDKEIDKAE